MRLDDLMCWIEIPSPPEPAAKSRPLVFCQLCNCPIAVDLPPASVILCGACEGMFLPPWLQEQINAPPLEEEPARTEATASLHAAYLARILSVKRFDQRMMCN